MDDRNPKYISSRRIVCEPMLWLIYVYRFLLDRQGKLWKLCLNCSNFGLETRAKAKKIQDIVSDLFKSAKEESDELQKLMSKLPTINDLKETFKRDIAERDPEKKFLYTRTLDDCYDLFFFLIIFFGLILYLSKRLHKHSCANGGGLGWVDGDSFLDTKKERIEQVIKKK
ncbi:hypothetical protein RFI_30925 [Reticulomyxa filosa]|uniref:Uncharacterized protein n=1 Tax=Reticulomyxa filosa TaxID=46433 RepID=X6LX12_RETFI|nr:hypothetical protein RFI_30925 [Reticulomyxa filosa]|eukprot:ETO06468.1 hypothetical protein RFI_30925 [Reticulomyxa filosa]